MSDKVEDASGERRVEWDKELAAGNLVQKTSLVRDTNEPGVLHVQGVALTEHEEARRIVPAEVMRHVMETKRYPDAPGKKVSMGAPPGGWPSFGPDGKRIS